MADELPTVEDFFYSVPTEVTKVPIFSDEDGTWFAYGHIDPYTMLLAIDTANSYNQGVPSELVVNPEDIQYYYAKIVTVNNIEPDWEDEVTFSTCKPTEEGAFPVSIWNY